MKIDFESFIKKLAIESSIQHVSINTMFELFLEQKKETRSEATYEYYIKQVKNIKKYLELRTVRNTSEINNLTILKYIEHLKQKGNCNKTINKIIQCLIQAMNYMKELDLINHDIPKYNKLKETDKEIQIFNYDDLEYILNIAKNINQESYLVILLLATTGIRRSELINIKTKNIDLKNKKIYLEFTKNKKARNIFLLDFICDIIKELDPKNEYLFNDWNVNKIDKLFEKLRKHYKQPISPHKIRHMYATTLLKKGANIYQVQQLLGHSKITTTAKYLHTNQNELFEANLMFNPLGEGVDPNTHLEIKKAI